MKYTILVDENSHFMDESERYIHGELETAEAALGAAKALVDADLESLRKPGMAADELYHYYITFGRDPYIVPKDEGCFFSAWDYAKQRCQEICGRAAQPDQNSCRSFLPDTIV